MLTNRTRITIGAALIGLAVLTLTAGSLFAQTPPPSATPSPTATTGTPITREQMNQWMDAMHGEGASKRMYEAMGPDAEKLMDQCLGQMGTLENMQGMMGGTGMSGMMGGSGNGTFGGMMGGSGTSGMGGGMMGGSGNGTFGGMMNGLRGR